VSEVCRDRGVLWPICGSEVCRDRGVSWPICGSEVCRDRGVTGVTGVCLDRGVTGTEVAEGWPMSPLHIVCGDRGVSPSGGVSWPMCGSEVCRGRGVADMSDPPR